MKLRLTRGSSIDKVGFHAVTRGYTFAKSNQWISEVENKDDIEFFKSFPKRFDFPEPKVKTKIDKKEKSKEIKDAGKFFTKKELEEKAGEEGFTKFKKWANKEFKVTGRSLDGLIKDILDVQSGKKEPEL